MLDELYTMNGVTKTARQFCDDNGVPYEVFEFRKKNLRALGAFLFMPSNNIVYYGGKAYTFDMIAHETGIDYDTIKTRYYNGIRGSDLFRSPETDYAANQRKRMEFECREHLRALVRAHKDMAVSILKGTVQGVVEEPTDPAAAMLNAQRFVAASQGYQVQSTGAIWDHAA